MKFGLDNLNPAVFGAVHQTRVQNASSAHDGALLNSPDANGSSDRRSVRQLATVGGRRTLGAEGAGGRA